MQLDLAACPEAPAEARRAVADLARTGGAGPSQLDAIATIVSEGVTNAVRHGYCSGPGPISVDASVRDDEMTIVITDCGRGLRDASPDPGMGLGWKLIAQLSDRWAVLPRVEQGTMLYAQLHLAG